MSMSLQHRNSTEKRIDDWDVGVNWNYADEQRSGVRQGIRSPDATVQFHHAGLRPGASSDQTQRTPLFGSPASPSFKAVLVHKEGRWLSLASAELQALCVRRIVRLRGQPQGWVWCGRAGTTSTASQTRSAAGAIVWSDGEWDFWWNLLLLTTPSRSYSFDMKYYDS